jgi:[acyl-carrier-protein] S-malonyltransferase
MARPFAEAWPETRATLERLDAAAGGERDLLELCCAEATDPARLGRTEHAQPAVYATGVAAAAGLRTATDCECEPALVAGHSLGHLTAGAVAGLFEPAAGFALAEARGEAMARAGERDGPGRMVAVLLADPGTVVAACDETAGASVAGFNAPRQTVVSGRHEAVARATDRIEETATRSRFVDLDVSAAFHSRVMASAADPVRTALDATPMDRSRVPVVSDVSGIAYREPATAREELAAQVRCPVDWRGVVETLRERGVDRYVEVPPAGTLAGFVGELDPDATVVALDGPADAAALGGA